jgi:hypothetical protein
MSRAVGEENRAQRFEAAHRRGLLRAMGTVVIALPLFVFSIVQGVFNLREALFAPIELECPAALPVPSGTVPSTVLHVSLPDPEVGLLPACHRQPHCFLARPGR